MLQNLADQKINTAEELDRILSVGDANLTLARMQDGSFEQLIPGLLACVGCGQGSKKHFEGDVARHIALVTANVVTIAKHDTTLMYDFVDRLAALIHDLEKPSTRIEKDDGSVSFPKHEERALTRIASISDKLGLTRQQQEKLTFLVGEHGVAHDLPILSDAEQRRLVSSKYWLNLRVLQKADAISCFLNAEGTAHVPVHWDLFESLRSKLGISAGMNVGSSRQSENIEVIDIESQVVCELQSELDWHAAARVLKVLRPNLDSESFVKDRTRLTAEGYRLIGIKVNGEVVSIASMVFAPHPVYFRELQIHDMATLEQFQSRGYGSRLLAEMEKIAFEQKCGRCVVQSRTERNSAHEFYRKNGYQDYSVGFIKKIVYISVV